MNSKRERGLLLSSQFLSEIGDWITFGCLMLLVYQLTSSPVAVSLILISQNIAVILSSTIGGTLADRMQPKKLMILSDLCRAGLICLIPFVASQYWLLYPLLMLITIFSTLFNPAKMKVIRRISTDEELASINSLSYGISGIVKILGFVFGGFIVVLSGYELPFFIDSISFVLSAILVACIRYEPERPDELGTPVSKEKTSLWNDMRVGFREIREIATLPKLMFIFVAGSLVMGLFVPQLVTYNSEILHGSESTYGLLNAAVAIGMLVVSALFTKVVQQWDPYRTMIVTAFLGVGVVLIVMTYLSFPTVLLALFLLGCVQTMPNLVALTLCQMIVPVHLLGRFFGLLNVFTTSAYVTGMMVGGLIASYSIEWMYRGTGLLAIALFLLSLVYQNRLRGGIRYTQSSATTGTES